MEFPAFFADAPMITFYDPLAKFLGASPTGRMTYGYADAVRFAGHSCPTVAGTYLMVYNGLKFLYGDETPERGNIEVFMADGRDEGVAGVMGNVAMLLTGAAPETGFHGIGGRFDRRDLLHFDAPIPGIMALRRMDTGKGVALDLDTSLVPPSPEMRPLMIKAVSGQATDEEGARFGELWQERVRHMVTEHSADSALVRAVEWRAAA